MKCPKMSLSKTVFSLKCHLPNAEKPSNYGLFCSNAVRTPAPRRRGLRIVRDDDFSFRTIVIAHSLRRSSFSKLNPLRWASIWVLFFAQSPLCSDAFLCLRQKKTSSARSLAPPSKSEALGFGFVFYYLADFVSFATTIFRRLSFALWQFCFYGVGRYCVVYVSTASIVRCGVRCRCSLLIKNG